MEKANFSTPLEMRHMQIIDEFWQRELELVLLFRTMFGIIVGKVKCASGFVLRLFRRV